MQFQFEGATYRIGFRHDPELNREWSAHRGHQVQLCRTDMEEGTSLYCESCDLVLAYNDRPVPPRRTQCVILRHDPEGWRPIGKGAGRLNVKAGDRFNREAGRIAALAACLNNLPSYFSENKDFRSKAWECYLKRSRPRPYSVEQSAPPARLQDEADGSRQEGARP